MNFALYEFIALAFPAASRQPCYMPHRREVLRPLIASCFGLGYSPIMPGTCGALLGPVFYIPLALAILDEPLQTVAIAVMLFAWSAITVALGGWSERYHNKKDSQIFVTDEVAGFLLTVLLFHDTSQPVLTTLWAFPITRIIDIIKIPPAKQLEKLPRGWGVLADDLMGSIYAAAALYVIWQLSKWFTMPFPLRPFIMHLS
jgi:phosphatidylglycerophosphatase A